MTLTPNQAKKPFDDIRVRRALNLAVNKQEIITSFYNGNAEMFAYPMHPDYVGYYEPLDKMRCILEQGMLCMGSVTRGGCGGDKQTPRCISARVPCRGCYGPVKENGNQRFDMLNALASNGIDIDSLPESVSLLRFSGGHSLLRPVVRKSKEA